MNPNLEKGNELERAIGSIESLILQKNPNLMNNPFIIENKKTVIIDEVRHEIDWYIEIDLGNGYKSIFLFECKNWDKPVGKNEIIIFSEVINTTQATKGYFVAKEFGKYAIAQSKKDSRIELLKVTDSLVEFIDFPHFHYVAPILESVAVIFDFGKASGKVESLEVNSIVYNGVSIEFHDFAEIFGKLIMNNRVNNESTASMPDNSYFYKEEDVFNFDDNVLVVNDEIVNKLKININFTLIVKKPKIITKFDVEKRGRVIEYENFYLPNNEISFKWVFLNEK